MDKETYSRRSFLSRFWLVLGALTFAELIVLLLSFFKPRRPRVTEESTEAVIVAGSVDSFEPGSVSAFIRGRFYLARLEDGGFLAMSRSCTHLSCTVPWVADENRFICPCHSSQFDIRGNVANPPAPRALDIYPITIENNVIKVDTSQPRKRTEFAADQVTYPKQT